MNASYIDKIRAHAITEWANGKCGEITYFEREIGREIERKYRFVEITSLKDLGKKWFGFSKMGVTTDELLSKM